MNNSAERHPLRQIAKKVSGVVGSFDQLPSASNLIDSSRMVVGRRPFLQAVVLSLTALVSAFGKKADVSLGQSGDGFLDQKPADGDKQEAREVLKQAIKDPVFDREAGSQNPEVYPKADKMLRELIADGKEAGGEFEAAVNWLGVHNQNVTTTVTRGVIPPGAEAGYGSIFSIVVFSGEEIKSIIDGTYAPDVPPNPLYGEVATKRFTYLNSVSNYHGNPKIKLLRHHLIINADISDTTNGSDLLDLALMVREIPDYDNKLASDVKAGVTEPAKLSDNMNDPGFKSEMYKKEGAIVYADLDRLITTQGSEYWRLSDDTQQELNSFRTLRAAGKV